MDESAAELIAKAVGTLRRLEDRLGSPAVARPALELRVLVEHFSRLSLEDGARTGLWTVTAELSQFLGWLAFDATDHSTARAYYQEGLRAAREGADQGMFLCLAGHVATLALSEEKVDEALSIIDSQTEHIAGYRCPVTRSWFTAVEAKIRAVAGDEAACRVALDRSRKAFEKAGPEAPVGLYFFDEAELRAYEGACYERIGRLELARHTWQLALSALGDDRVRDRAEYLVHFAEIHARQGEIEEACRLASDALAIAVETGSVRANDQVHRLRTQLDPWKETRVVRDLDDRLALVR